MRTREYAKNKMLKSQGFRHVGMSMPPSTQSYNEERVIYLEEMQGKKQWYRQHILESTEHEQTMPFFKGWHRERERVGMLPGTHANRGRAWHGEIG